MLYSRLTKLYDQLNSTTKRLEKTSYIAAFLEDVDNIEEVMLLLRGKIFDDYEDKDLGISNKLIIKTIASATGIREENVEKKWKEKGDIGDAGEELFKSNKQMTLFSEDLTTERIMKELRRIGELEGKGSVSLKIRRIASLLNSATPREARYLIRTILGDMRTGASEGTIRDAIAKAFLDGRTEELENAINMTNDYGLVARKASEEGIDGLKKIGIIVGKPVKLMLFPKGEGIKESLEKFENPSIEYKYDGFRVQIHKGEDTSIFTRRMENVTEQFPELVEYVNRIKAKSIVIDGEVVGYDRTTREYLPFQNISQRIKRKYDIDEMSRKFPVELNIFDILYKDGKSLLNTKLRDRRALLEDIVPQKEREIVLAEKIETDDMEKAEKFYEYALKKGFEGVMIKDLEGIYKPGKRVGYGLKVKPVMKELDLAITKAEWGTGKRGKWLTSYTLSIMEDDEFYEIGKASSGLKELEGLTYEKMTKLLKPLIREEKGREAIVAPKIIVEVNYEEIQKSPTYSSGYALRFPRIIRLRDDKSLEEIANLKQVEKLYKNQK